MIVGKGSFTRGTGIQTSYYPDGKVCQVTHYSKNEKDGEEIFYKPDGKVDRVNIFEHGRRTVRTTRIPAK